MRLKYRFIGANSFDFSTISKTSSRNKPPIGIQTKTKSANATRFIWWLFTFLYFSGCIPVDEIESKLWETSSLDPCLAGHWKMNNNDFPYTAQYLSIIKAGKSYKYLMEGTRFWPDEELPWLEVRTIELNNNKFLLFKGIGDSIGSDSIKKETLQESNGVTDETLSTSHRISENLKDGVRKYETKGDQLTFYALKKGGLNQIISKKIIKGETFGSSDLAEGKLHHLDHETLKVLSDYSEKEGLWEPVCKYHRVESVEDHIDKTMWVDTQFKINLNKMDWLWSEDQVDRILNHFDSLPEWKRRNDPNHTRFHLVRWPPENRHSTGELSGYDYVRLDNPKVFELSSEEEDQELEKARKSWFVMGANLLYVDDVNDLNPFKEHYSVLVNPADTNEIDLRLWRDDQGMHSSIFIGQDRLWLEIEEISRYEDRRKTLQFIDYIMKIFDELKTSGD